MVDDMPTVNGAWTEPTASCLPMLAHFANHN